MYDTLVIGGSGFLGSHLCAALKRIGRTVLVVDDQRSADPLGLRPAVEATILNRSYEDVIDEVFTDNPGLQTVYHLAAAPLRVHAHTSRGCEEAMDSSLRGVAKLLDYLCLKEWPGRLVYVSSSEVYGTSPPPHGDDGKCIPATPYAASRYAAERMVAHCATPSGAAGIDAVIARLFNLYGSYGHYEGERGEVIPRFMVSAILGKPLTVYGGKTIRDFLWVSDATDALMKVATDGSRGLVYSFGSGEGCNIQGLAKLIVEICRSNSEIRILGERQGDIPLLVWQGTGMGNIGWLPTTRLPAGLSSLYAWYTELGAEMLDQMFALMPERTY